MKIENLYEGGTEFMDSIVDMGKYIYVLDKKLGYGLAYILNVRPINVKFNNTRALSFKNNDDFKKALDYMLSYKR